MKNIILLSFVCVLCFSCVDRTNDTQTSTPPNTPTNDNQNTQFVPDTIKVKPIEKGKGSYQEEPETVPSTTPETLPSTAAPTASAPPPKPTPTPNTSTHPK